MTGLLTSALGNYIDPKCFSSDKINVAVWSGYVVLHALEIKPDVIAHPALNLVRGMIGSIELKIPWNRLNSDSVVVTIDDVYLLVRTEEDIERAMLEMDEFTIKKKLLEELYAQAKRQQDEGAEDDTASTSEKGFAARLVNKIIDNLEVRRDDLARICDMHMALYYVQISSHSCSLSLASFTDSSTSAASTFASKTIQPETTRSPSDWRSSLSTSRYSPR